MTTIDKLADFADVEVKGGGDDYEAPRDTAAPPPAAQYTFTRIDETNGSGQHEFEMVEEGKKWKCKICEGDTTHGRSIARNGEKMAWFRFKLAIQGGQFDGRFVFDGCSTYVGDYPPATATHYLRAMRSSLRPLMVPAYEDAVLKAFSPFNAVTDWEWRCRTCEETFLTGAKSPKKPKKYVGKIGPIKRTSDGRVDYEQVCPGCGAAVVAQSKIKRFVVPKTGAVTVAQGGGGPAVELPPAEG